MPTSQADKLDDLHTKVCQMHALFIGIDGQPGQFPNLVTEVARNSKRIGVIERFVWTLTGAGVIGGYIMNHLFEAIHTLSDLHKLTALAKYTFLITVPYWRF